MLLDDKVTNHGAVTNKQGIEVTIFTTCVTFYRWYPSCCIFEHHKTCLRKIILSLCYPNAHGNSHFNRTVNSVKTYRMMLRQTNKQWVKLCFFCRQSTDSSICATHCKVSWETYPYLINAELQMSLCDHKNVNEALGWAERQYQPCTDVFACFVHHCRKQTACGPFFDCWTKKKEAFNDSSYSNVKKRGCSW